MPERWKFNATRDLNRLTNVAESALPDLNRELARLNDNLEQRADLGENDRVIPIDVLLAAHGIVEEELSELEEYGETEGDWVNHVRDTAEALEDVLDE